MQVEEIIKSQIVKKNRSMRLDIFLKKALFSKDGYYTKRKPIGKIKDFITAPEISQIFGEIVGMYLYYFWKTKINSEYNLIELGPGKATLFIDIANSVSNLPGFLKKSEISFIEINHELIKLQKENTKRLLKNIKWKKNINFKSNIPSIIYSNEFFDCFPVRQFTYNDVWFEKYVNFNRENDSFYFENKQVNSKKLLTQLNLHKKNKLLEVSFERNKYFENVCKFIKKNRGIFLTVDYGYFKNNKNFTLQAVQNHKFSHVLENIGEKDISSHVNFEDLINVAKQNNLKIEECSTQREFLLKFGILERKKIFNNSKYSKKIDTEVDRLINNNKMGNLFKFLVISNL